VSPANLNTAAYWNQVYRDEYASGRMQSEHYHRDYGLIHDAIVRLIPDGSRVLDVACGPALLCRKIKQRLPATQVLGVDFSECVIARNRGRDEGLGIEYRCLDIRSALGDIGRTFDVIAMCEIIEHLETPAAVVGDALRLLRSGGRFIVTCPHDAGIPDPEHVRDWGHDELFHLLAPYSDTIAFQHFPPPYFHEWMLAYLTKTADDVRGARAG
jgi:2-polyprenyl-3-methyl-5-hydroxy-6-metoxy-1,4-benzoquinol methylase